MTARSKVIVGSAVLVLLPLSVSAFVAGWYLVHTTGVVIGACVTVVLAVGYLTALLMSVTAGAAGAGVVWQARALRWAICAILALCCSGEVAQGGNWVGVVLLLIAPVMLALAGEAAVDYVTAIPAAAAEPVADEV